MGSCQTKATNTIKVEKFTAPCVVIIVDNQVKNPKEIYKTIEQQLPTTFSINYISNKKQFYTSEVEVSKLQSEQVLFWVFTKKSFETYKNIKKESYKEGSEYTLVYSPDIEKQELANEYNDLNSLAKSMLSKVKQYSTDRDMDLEYDYVKSGKSLLHYFVNDEKNVFLLYLEKLAKFPKQEYSMDRARIDLHEKIEVFIRRVFQKTEREIMDKLNEIILKLQSAEENKNFYLAILETPILRDIVNSAFCSLDIKDIFQIRYLLYKIKSNENSVDIREVDEVFLGGITSRSEINSYLTNNDQILNSLGLIRVYNKLDAFNQFKPQTETEKNVMYQFSKLKVVFVNGIPLCLNNLYPSFVIESTSVKQESKFKYTSVTLREVERFKDSSYETKMTELADNYQVDIFFTAATFSFLEKHNKALDLLRDYEETIQENQLKSFFILKANICEETKDYEECLKCYEKALEIKSEEKSDKDEEAAELLNKIGTTHYNIGKNCDLALEFYNKALKIHFNKNRNTETLDTAMIYSNIALVYETDKDYTKALDYLIKALKVYQDNLDPNDITIASLLNNIGIIYFNINEFNKSLEYYIQSLKIKEKILEAWDLSIAMTLSNIAFILFSSKKYQQSLNYYKKALRIKTTNFGSNPNESTGDTYFSLGCVYFGLRDFSKAHECFDKFLTIKAQLNLPSSHTEANVYSYLGKMAIMNDITLANQYFDKSLEINYDVFGDKSREYIESLAELNICLGEQNKIEVALENFKKIVKYAEVNKLPLLSDYYFELGNLYIKNKNILNAQEILGSSLKLKLELKDEVGVAKVKFGQGKIHILEQQLDKALNLLNESVALLGDKDRKDLLGEVEKTIAEVFKSKDDMKHSYEHYTNARACFFNFYGAGHEKTMEVDNLLRK